MKTITFTEFRNHASGLISEVEQGETLIVMRHGRPVAEVTPPGETDSGGRHWMKPGLRLAVRGVALSRAVLEAREREDLS